MEHVISIGGGISSTLLLVDRVLAKYPRESVHAVICPVDNEHPDVWRLCDAVSKRYGIQIHKIGESADIWKVFFQQHMMGNPFADPCSRILKREKMAAYMKQYDPANTTLHVGITADEIDRMLAITRNWNKQGYKVEADLADEPKLNREALIEMCKVEFGFAPQLYLEGFSHNNCFAGETRYLTEGGVKSFSETAGQTVSVLSKYGRWVETTVQSFGKQQIWELTLNRNGETKTIATTADHRWLIYRGERSKNEGESLTRDLKEGTRLMSMFGGKMAGVRPSSFGIAHGITFGDGTMHYEGQSFATLTLCGEKDQTLAKWFPLSPSSAVQGVGIKIADLPRYFKDKPSIKESKSYLLGWLMGYFAADGTVHDDGSASIASASRENLEFVKDVCSRLGVGTRSIRGSNRIGLGKEATVLYTMYFVRHTIPDEFFLIEEHKRRHDAYPLQTKFEAAWRVKSVQATDRFEEVYCVNVPEYHAFTLEDNILTGNCGGFCVKAGKGQMARLLYYHPDVYRYHERMEQTHQRFFCHDNTIMRDEWSKGGVRGADPLSLMSFRQRMESRWMNLLPGFDPFDGLDATPGCSFCDAAA